MNWPNPVSVRMAQVAIRSPLVALVVLFALTLGSGISVSASAAPMHPGADVPQGRSAARDSVAAEEAPSRPQRTWRQQGAELIREAAASASRYFSAGSEQSTPRTVGLHGPLDYFGALGMQPAWDGKCAAKEPRYLDDAPQTY